MLKERKIYSLYVVIGFFKIFKLNFNAIIYKQNFIMSDGLANIPQFSSDIDLDSDAVIILSNPSDIMEYNGYNKIILNSYYRYGTNLSKSSSDILKSYSSNNRKAIRSSLDKISKLDYHIDIYDTKKDILDNYHRIYELSRQTYQYKILKSAPTAIDEFITSNGQDNAVIFILKINNIDVGYFLCSTREDIITTDYTGYLSDYEKYSVGTVLKWKMIEYLTISQKYSFMDYNLGENLHKMRFSTDKILCYDILLYKKNSRNIIKISLWRLGNYCDKIMIRFLEHFGIKDKIKRFFKKI